MTEGLRNRLQPASILDKLIDDILGGNHSPILGLPLLGDIQDNPPGVQIAGQRSCEHADVERPELCRDSWDR
jgi:hypothetical protein